MLDRLNRLLTGGPPQARPAARSFEERQLAAAALMVEAATMDDAFETGSMPQIHVSLGALQGSMPPAETRVSGD